jgi:hypothetical protein
MDDAQAEWCREIEGRAVFRLVQRDGVIVFVLALQDPSAWIEELRSGDLEARDRAYRALLDLGPRIAPRLEEELRRAEDPYLRQALEVFAPWREDPFVLARLDQPMPKRERSRFSLGPCTVAEAVEKIAKNWNLKIEYRDDAIARRAGETGILAEAVYTNAEPESPLFWAATVWLDAIYWIEPDRIVIADLTIRTLLERLARDGHRTTREWSGLRPMEFYLEELAKARGRRYERRRDELLKAAQDDWLPVRLRRAALCGLGWIRRQGRFSLEAERVLVGLALDAKAPWELRTEAALELIPGQGRAAGATVCILLQSAPFPTRSAILHEAAMHGESCVQSWMVVPLEDSSDDDVAIRATAVRLQLREEDARISNFKRPMKDPRTREVLQEVLETTSLLPEHEDAIREALRR